MPSLPRRILHVLEVVEQDWRRTLQKVAPCLLMETSAQGAIPHLESPRWQMGDAAPAYHPVRAKIDVLRWISLHFLPGIRQAHDLLIERRSVKGLKL